ncbi:MAG: O-antigen ligase family protein [Verrucomicrobia bacterium]|nr:O-antigen ligase family protein [Verrucomicrobiota bacterium]
MLRERLNRACERSLIGLALGILVFGPLATGAVRTLDFLIIQGLTIGVITLWVARLWLDQDYRLLWPPICWAVLAFVAYAIARYQFATVEFLARNELIRVLVYAFLFLAMLNNLYRQETTQCVALLLVFLAMAISLYAGFQFLTQSQRVWDFVQPAQFRGRASGTYICPDHLAGFLEMILPLGLSYLFTSRFSPVLKVYLGYASLAILSGIGFSVSRGGWIATIASLLAFFAVLVRRRNCRLPAVLALLLLTAAVTGFICHTQRVEERLKDMLTPGRAQDPRSRLALWGPAWRMWRDHPWWGVGPGHFDARFDQYRAATFQLRGQYVHNDYLNTLTDWGAVGAAFVAAAWLILFLGVLNSWRFVAYPASTPVGMPSNRAAFVLGAGIGLLAILLHSFVDFNMQIPANAILAVTLMALLCSHLRFTSDRYWVRLGLAGKVLVTAVCLAGVVYLGNNARHRATEFVWLQRARRARTAVEQVEAMKQACAAEPTDFEVWSQAGEIMRRLSWRGNDDYRQWAEAAMQRFKRAAALNPFAPYNFSQYGRCLDWLGRHEEAGRYFQHALNLDPNGWYTIECMGWHYLQIGDYLKAREWFDRAVRYKWLWPGDSSAATYLRIIDQRLAEPKH